MPRACASPVHPALKKHLLANLTCSLVHDMVLAPMPQISTTGVTGATLDFSPGLGIARPITPVIHAPVYPMPTG
jgi:hypothetical protein